MSTIGRIGSTLKRAALYVPRRIANKLQRTKIGVIPIQSMPGHYVKITVGGNHIIALGIYKKASGKTKIGDARGAREKQLLVDEQVGPFTGTAVKDGMLSQVVASQHFVKDEQVGPFAVTAKPVAQSWPHHDQGYFGEPINKAIPHWPAHDQDGYFDKPQAFAQKRRWGAIVEYRLASLLSYFKPKKPE